MRIKFSSDTRRNRRDAASYYKSISPGIALAFQRDLQSALQYLITYPLGAPRRHGDVRAKRLLRFPYTIFHRVLGQDLFILSIAHQSRDPADDSSRF